MFSIVALTMSLLSRWYLGLVRRSLADIRFKDLTALLGPSLVATKSMIYVLETTPKLLHVVKTNYGLGRGLRARLSPTYC